MPSSSPQRVTMAASNVQVPMADNHLFVQVIIQGDGQEDPGAVQALVQEVTDMFQGWDKANPLADVTGQYYQTDLYGVTPTNPLPPPPPPPEG